MNFKVILWIIFTSILLAVFSPLGILVIGISVLWYLSRLEALWNDKPPKKKKGVKEEEDNKREKMQRKIYPEFEKELNADKYKDMQLRFK